jgi:hypothetical protein
MLSKSINNYIIKKSEDYFIEEKKNILFLKKSELEYLFVFVILYSLALIIPLINMTGEVSLTSVLFDYFFIVVPIILLTIGQMKSKKIIMLHYLVFWNKKEREEEVEAYVSNNSDNLISLMSSNSEQESIRHDTLDKKVDLYIKNIDIFCKEHLLDNNSLKRFVKERLQSETNENRAFILWCMIIPNKEELSLDGLKFLISQNRMSFYNYVAFKQQGKEFIHSILSNQIHCFKDFSEKKLKRVFSINYESSILMDVLIFSYNNDFIIPNRLKNLIEIEKFVELNKDLIKLNNEKLKQVNRNPRLYFIENKKFRNLKFIVLDDTEDLISWGVDLSNCIKTYRDRCLNGYSYLLGIYKDGKKYGNIELDCNNKIVQIRGFANKPLDEESDIKDIVNLVLF